IPDRTYRAMSLCRLANHMPASGRDNVYVEAFAIVEQMDENLTRVDSLIQISKCLPADKRAEAAKRVWQILRHPQDGPDDNTRTRVYALSKIIPYLREAEAAQAARQAIKILEKMPEEERYYPAQDLQSALRSRTEFDNRPRRPNVIEGPKFRLQREL